MTTIPHLFFQSAERFSTRSALLEPLDTGEIACLSYADMQKRSEGFAGYLQKQHIKSGDRLLLWCPSRIDWLIAYLGTLLVGMVVVPLDVSSKEDFLRRIAETTESRFLITTQKHYTGLKKPPVPLIDIDALPQEDFDSTQVPIAQEDDLAELVFTSGTTGQPKGVMLSHKNIVSNVLAALAVIDVSANDRALSILPLSHMFELMIDIALLAKGASILYARTLSPDTLLKLLGSQHVSVMVLVPQALQLFLSGIEREVRRQKREKAWEILHRIASYMPFALRHFLFRAVHMRFGGHFRFFVSGGAYLPPKLGQRWENMGFRVIQGYGATECAPVIAATPLREHNLTSVGKPLPGVEVRIANDKEILVHGPNVALGYWKNPEATALAFQDGWYHTGDLGTIDERGDLYLKGRKKNLIVLANGMNVYPEDIENIFTTIPGIKDAVVIGLTEGEQDPQVHGILLVDDASKAKAIVQQVNKQLASHQQVRSFTIWPHDDFPRTHTMKVKRQDVLAMLPTIRKRVGA
ncbi:MAG: hypothetical protein NVS4B12_09100 [Ktedonobacteraceae bacterium]